MSTDEVDASNDDDVSMTAAMGGATDQNQRTTTHVPEADRIPYPEMVKRGAEFLRDGVCEIWQIQPKEYHDATEEEFLADVRDKLDEMDGGSDEFQTSGKETNVDTVDWAALWDEFGFGDGDVDGNKFVSPTQLETALECTDQACPSGKATISQAVDDGDLHELTAKGAKGEIATRGYVRTQGGDSR